MYEWLDWALLVGMVLFTLFTVVAAFSGNGLGLFLYAVIAAVCGYIFAERASKRRQTKAAAARPKATTRSP
jgi:predicted lipid-binding transport protein (Tim44 family)